MAQQDSQWEHFLLPPSNNPVNHDPLSEFMDLDPSFSELFPQNHALDAHVSLPQQRGNSSGPMFPDFRPQVPTRLTPQSMLRPRTPTDARITRLPAGYFVPRSRTPETPKKAMAGKAGVSTRKPIEGDCSVCWEPFEPAQTLLYCKTTCGHNFHRACFVEWVTAPKNRETPSAVRCPMCRGLWDEEELRMIQMENGITPSRAKKTSRARHISEMRREHIMRGYRRRSLEGSRNGGVRPPLRVGGADISPSSPPPQRLSESLLPQGSIISPPSAIPPPQGQPQQSYLPPQQAPAHQSRPSLYSPMLLQSPYSHQVPYSQPMINNSAQGAMPPFQSFATRTYSPAVQPPSSLPYPPRRLGFDAPPPLSNMHFQHQSTPMQAMTGGPSAQQSPTLMQQGSNLPPFNSPTSNHFSSNNFVDQPPQAFGHSRFNSLTSEVEHTEMPRLQSQHQSQPQIQQPAMRMQHIQHQHHQLQPPPGLYQQHQHDPLAQQTQHRCPAMRNIGMSQQNMDLHPPMPLSFGMPSLGNGPLPQHMFSSPSVGYIHFQYEGYTAWLTNPTFPA